MKCKLTSVHHPLHIDNDWIDNNPFLVPCGLFFLLCNAMMIRLPVNLCAGYEINSLYWHNIMFLILKFTSSLLSSYSQISMLSTWHTIPHVVPPILARDDIPWCLGSVLPDGSDKIRLGLYALHLAKKENKRREYVNFDHLRNIKWIGIYCSLWSGISNIPLFLDGMNCLAMQALKSKHTRFQYQHTDPFVSWLTS